MDHERKELLAQKKAQLKKRQKRAEIQQYKDRLTKSIEHFSQKYRYADEAEALKIETFISKLNFEQPGQLAIQEVCPYPHGNVYLCFLMGTDALFQIYVFGKYSDIMSDHDAWEVSVHTCCLWTRILFITLISTIMAKSWNHKYRNGGERAWTPMNKESLTEKLLDLAEGRETPETWQNWWDEHETELEALLSRGEFLKLKPCRHGFQWVPVFGSQKGAIAILEKSGLAFEASNLYQERYLAELDAFCKEQERVQREKQAKFKADNPEMFRRYPKFSKALAKVLDPTDEIKPAATEEQIGNQESVLDFTLPSQVREFFLLTAGINVSTGVILTLSGMFDPTIHGERYCVLGEFWKEADGDQLLLRPGEETIWYYAHEQDKVKRLCNDMTELLEKKLARYLNEH